MQKSTLNFWLDLGLFALLVLTILTAVIDIVIPCFVHVFFGLLLSAGAIAHVALHWQWIANVVKRFSHLPDQVRASFLLNLALFLAYSAAGAMGLLARSFIFFGPLRHVVGFFHVLIVFGVLVLQTIHLARHWKWLTVTAQKALTGSEA